VEAAWTKTGLVSLNTDMDDDYWKTPDLLDLRRSPSASIPRHLLDMWYAGLQERMMRNLKEIERLQKSGSPPGAPPK